MKQFVFLIWVLLLLLGCAAKEPGAPVEQIKEPQTTVQQEIVEEPTPEQPEPKSEPDPAEPEFTPQQQALLNSQLVEFDPGLIYEYIGESLTFQPKGWNVAVQIPEDWKDRVTVLCTHPCGESVTIKLVPNDLIEAYMTGLERPKSCSYYDYCLRLICQPKENGPETYPDACVKIFEDEETAYYLETMLERSPNSQESQLQQLLIEKIGQVQYDAITKDFLLTIESAKNLFVFKDH